MYMQEYIIFNVTQVVNTILFIQNLVKNIKILNTEKTKKLYKKL